MFSRFVLRRMFASHGVASSPRAPPRKRRFLRRLIFVTIGGLGLYGLSHSVVDPERKFPWFVAERLPLNALSRGTGVVARWHIPEALRSPIFGLYVRLYDCKMHEAVIEDVRRYETLEAFFMRHLKPTARPITSVGMASPVDGTVLHYGVVDASMRLEDIKGSSFAIDEFLGPLDASSAPTMPGRGDSLDLGSETQSTPTPTTIQTTPTTMTLTTTVETSTELSTAAMSTNTPMPTPSRPRQLYFCTIYLAPGDYHGIHAPHTMRLEWRRHLPGLLLPVSPIIVNLLNGLFCVNERVTLFGRWKHGFSSITMVGATNVGSVLLRHESQLSTNVFPALQRPFYDHAFAQPVVVQAGEEVAFFNLGSTVVLVFESPTFAFSVKNGDKVQLGQMIGRVVDE